MIGTDAALATKGEARKARFANLFTRHTGPDPAAKDWDPGAGRAEDGPSPECIRGEGVQTQKMNMVRIEMMTKNR